MRKKIKLKNQAVVSYMSKIFSFIAHIALSLSSSVYSSTNPPSHRAGPRALSCLHWTTPRSGLRLHESSEVGNSSLTSAPQHSSNFWWGYASSGFLSWGLGYCLEPNDPSALPFMLQNPLVILQYERHAPALGVSVVQSNSWRLTTLRAQGYDEHDKKRSLHPL